MAPPPAAPRAPLPPGGGRAPSWTPLNSSNGPSSGCSSSSPGHRDAIISREAQAWEAEEALGVGRQQASWRGGSTFTCLQYHR